MKQTILLPMLVTVMMVVGAVMAQDPSPSSAALDQRPESTTPLIPSGNVKVQGVLGKADRRRDLVRQVTQLMMAQSVRESVLQEAKGAYDGTALMALQYHLVAIEMNSDLADILPMLSATIDNLRAEVRTDLVQKKDLAEQRAEEVQKCQSEIDNLGEQILSGKNTNGSELSDDELDDLLALDHQKIMHRNERIADLEGYMDTVNTYEQELTDLSKLDRRMEGKAAVSQAHLERLMDAVENEREGIVDESVVDSRKLLQDVIATFETRTKTPDGPIPGTRNNRPQRSGVSAGDLAERFKTELQPEERRVVDEELEKLRQRKGKSKEN